MITNFELFQIISPFVQPPTYIDDLRIKDDWDYAMELRTVTTVDHWNETISKISIPMRAAIETSGIIHQILPS